MTGKGFENCYTAQYFRSLRGILLRSHGACSKLGTVNRFKWSSSTLWISRTNNGLCTYTSGLAMDAQLSSSLFAGDGYGQSDPCTQRIMVFASRRNVQKSRQW